MHQIRPETRWPRPWRASHNALGIAGALLVTAGLAQGRDVTWDGGGPDDLWTTDANWVGDDAPELDLTSCLLIFGPTGAAQSPDAGNDDYFNIFGLHFTGADASLNLIGSGSLSFDPNAFIRNDSGFAQTIDIDLVGNGSLLVLDASAADLTIGGRIDLSGDSGTDMVTLRILGANGTTITGRIRGDGDLLLTGTGVITLSGNNIYTGGTSLSSGTGVVLILGHDNALGTGDLRVVTSNSIQADAPDDGDRTIGNDILLDPGATLTFSGGENLTLNGVISGDGNLELNTDTEDEQRLTLNGENTYLGDTLITLGTIVLGNDAALGESNLILNGDGTLRSSADGRVIANDVFLNGNTLTIDGNRSLELSGILDDTAGPGTFRKRGDGNLTLSGDSAATFTGLVRVAEGELLLTGSVGGDVNVNDGGRLAGDGSIGGALTINDGGTVRVGTSIGTLTVDGDFQLGEADGDDVGGTLVVELSDTLDADLLAVGGNATLEAGSIIEASITGEHYIPGGQDFTIISATNITAPPDLEGIEINLTSVTVTLSLTADLSAPFTDLDLVLVRASNAYEAAAEGPNNKAIGRALDSLQPIADANPLSVAAGLLAPLDSRDSKDYNKVVKQLSPEPYNALTTTVIDSAQAFTSQQSTYLATRRSGLGAMVQAVHPVGPRPGSLALAQSNPALLAAAFAQAETAPQAPAQDGRWSNYVKVQGVFSDQDTTPTRTGYHGSLIGGQVGVDYAFSDELLAGLAFGYTGTNVRLADGLGTLDDETLRAGPYVSWTSGNWYVDGSMTFGYHFYDGDRNILELGRVAASDYDGFDVTGYIGAGYQYELDRNIFLTPIASMQYSYFDFDGFTEAGAGGANLTVAARSLNSLRSRLGANLSLHLDDWGVNLVPYFFLGWEHEVFDDGEIEATFAAGGNPFVIDTGSRGRDILFVGGGLNALIKHNVSAFIRYEGAYAGESKVSGVAAGLSIAF